MLAAAPSKLGLFSLDFFFTQSINGRKKTPKEREMGNKNICQKPLGLGKLLLARNWQQEARGKKIVRL